jgi:hypothetical protein
MKVSPEAVLDHFVSNWGAAPGLPCRLGMQLEKAKALYDDDGRKLVRLSRKRDVVFGEMFVRDDSRPDPHAATDRLHDELIANAEANACARRFRATSYFACLELDAIRSLAMISGLGEGTIAASVIAEYQRWAMTDSRASGRNQLLGEVPMNTYGTNATHYISIREGMAEGRERRQRDAELERRALRAVADWLHARVGLVQSDEETALNQALTIYREAVHALAEWVEQRSPRKGNGKQDTWIRLAEAARRSGIPERTLQQQCQNGDLPSRKRSSKTGSDAWHINLSACVRACADDRGAELLLEHLRGDAESWAPQVFSAQLGEAA